MIRKLIIAGLASVLIAATAAGATNTAQAASTVLWSANTNLTPQQNFPELQTLPGRITIANDPLGRYGRSFRYETWQNRDGSKARCESRVCRSHRVGHAWAGPV